MSDLWGRTWSLSIGTLDLSDLDLAFKVSRSSRQAPNLAEIRVWNLNATSRAAAEAGGTVTLRAGLGEGDPPVIFRGDTRSVGTTREGTDYITLLEARDGGRAYSEVRVSRSYGAGTPVTTVLRDVVEAMEIGEGNLSEFESNYRLRNNATTFAAGYVASGPARRVLTDLVRGAGLRWSVQGGALQLMRQGQPLQSRAVVLSSDSGLVESPTWDDNRRRRAVSAKCLIQPGLDPGRKVRLESELIEGDFEVRSIEYTGDTRGNDWHATMELRPVA